jgi:hypothetical protein
MSSIDVMLAGATHNVSQLPEIVRVQRHSTGLRTGIRQCMKIGVPDAICAVIGPQEFSEARHIKRLQKMVTLQEDSRLLLGNTSGVDKKA